MLDMSTQRKQRKPIEQGNTGRTVAENLARIRELTGMTAEELVNKMAEEGHNMPRTAISDLEGGYRRVTVDDLIALSIALQVNPNALLMPDYNGDVDVSDQVTTAAKGTTGADLWAWADGWNALPQQRENAPEVDENTTGMERGRQLAKRRRVTESLDFITTVRPSSEERTSRNFLARIREQIENLQSGEWLSLWWHAADKEPFSSRIAEWPETSITGGGMRAYSERMSREIDGIKQSPEARYAEHAKRDTNGDN